MDPELVMAGQPGPAFGRPGCKLVPAIPLRQALRPSSGSPGLGASRRPGDDKEGAVAAPYFETPAFGGRPRMTDGQRQPVNF
jgi:hypothetical protein